MKFSENFLGVLKHFQTINPNMYFVKGFEQTSALKTTGGSPLLFARAITDVEIDHEFGVAKLNKLINTLSLFDNPDIVVDGADLVISDDNTVVRYALTLPDYCSYEKNPARFKKDPQGIQGRLLKATLEKAMKFHGVVKGQYLSFIGEDGDFLLRVKSNQSNNDEMVIKIGDTDQTFNATIDIKNLVVPSTDYDIVILRKGAVYLKNDKLDFYIRCDANNSILE